MNVAATSPRPQRPNEKPAPTGERVMVRSDALFSGACHYFLLALISTGACLPRANDTDCRVNPISLAISVSDRLQSTSDQSLLGLTVWGAINRRRAETIAGFMPNCSAISPVVFRQSTLPQETARRVAASRTLRVMACRIPQFGQTTQIRWGFAFGIGLGKSFLRCIASEADDVFRAVGKQAVVVLPFFALAGLVEIGSATASEMPYAGKTDVSSLCVSVNFDLKHWTARAPSGGSVGAGCGSLGGCFGSSSLASEGGGGGGDIGGVCHGIVWLVGASLPADEGTIPNRLGFARTIFDYFSPPPLGLPENA